MRARVVAALALALALALAGCKDKGPPPPATSASARAETDAVASARRPVRRYYLERTATRCEVYFADPGSRSQPPLITPCPLELQVGERIRIAGKTCVREGGDPERVEPMVCPDPLTNFEIKDRGEKRY